jgi:hypothetical protein
MNMWENFWEFGSICNVLIINIYIHPNLIFFLGGGFFGESIFWRRVFFGRFFGRGFFFGRILGGFLECVTY